MSTLTTRLDRKMAIEPAGWNVVVIGAWNVAILTPDGVRKRLLDLPEGTPVEIEVPVDRPGPYRIRHDGIIATPSPMALEVAAMEPSPENLKRACCIAAKALTALPETPVTAAGVNIRYSGRELPDALLDMTKMRLDEALSDQGYEITSHTIRHSLKLLPGVVNLDLTIKPDGDGSVSFNYHLDSEQPSQLMEWLGRSAEFIESADKLLSILSVE